MSTPNLFDGMNDSFTTEEFLLAAKEKGIKLKSKEAARGVLDNCKRVVPLGKDVWYVLPNMALLKCTRGPFPSGGTA